MAKTGKRVRDIAAKWDDVLLVCRKCSKKVHGGFGKDDAVPLAKALKSELKGKRRYKIVSVSCLDICPKGAVCLVQPSVPGRVHLVAAGTPLDEVVAALDFKDG